MRVGRIGHLCAAAAAALLGATAATAAQPAAFAQKHTKADTAAAQRASLTLADLGSGFTTSATGGAESALTCASNHPDLSGVVETGAAASDTFQGGAHGPFVSESAWVYKTDAQAQLLWTKVVGAKLLDCLAASVRQGSTSGAKFEIRARRVLALPTTHRRRAGYRVVATATTSGQTVDVYYDLVVVGSGRGVAEISFARVGAPMTPSTEAKLASRVERRLGAIRPA